MSLFSFLRKDKQETASDDAPFVSRAEGESKARRSRGGRKGNAAEVKDPALPEKKRARRRLIGAVALVLAAIIGLPMILDSEPKPLADDIAIRIPSKDQAEPLAPPRSAPAASSLAASSALDPNEEVVEPTPTDNAPAPIAAPPHVAEAAPKAAPAPVVPEKPKTSVAAHQDKTESKATAKADKPDDATRALALLEGKPDPKADKKPAGKFVIQVAALASKEKVTELQSKLKDAGIKSYTQKVATGSGERIRIRVGPFASKDEADKVKARIVKLGLSGTLIPA